MHGIGPYRFPAYEYLYAAGYQSKWRLDRCFDDEDDGDDVCALLLQTTFQLVRVERGVKNRPVNLKFVDAVACVPESFTGFDDFILPGAELQKSDFLAKAKLPQDKFYIEFNR